ncbi:T9SS type A sorting domain-containing protein [Lewinella sp. W8]|uniref:T9SS type A sorting domain-containing protein n=1 Tax=Lewinella sp. W8 TaxID=2528208 RepID=UPI00106730BB|nr:T9SS type A sorting domain-containing protein [Lewinella sp. W8]MTB49726.1 alpha/beta fold hydrolase [Lewinella sp. W8]
MRLLSTLTCLLFVFPTFAQEVISVEEQDFNFEFVLDVLLPIDAEYDVQNYKVVYTTVDAFGQPDTASGMLSLPLDQELVFPLAVYNHGTVPNREAVPSREGVFERNLVIALAAKGFISLAPDYVGLGDSEGFHPYVHADSEASAGRDMLIAVRGWLESREIPFNEQVFVTGYSQGGHAAQALHRELELNTDIAVTAGAHLSGPYSISDIMLNTLFSEELATLPGYIAYTYISYNNVYGWFDSLDQVFVDPYLPVIDSLDQLQMSLGEFNVRLDTLLRQNDAVVSDIFQDSVLQVLQTQDPDNVIIQSLQDNDTYDWAPVSPTLLYYCTEDEQVPFQNALLADSVMRANGSTVVEIATGGPLNHGGCVVPAFTATLDFFAQFANVYSVSLGAPIERPEISLQPNPATRGDNLQLRGLPAGAHPFFIYDQSGRQLLSGLTADNGGIRLPGTLPAGWHLVRVGLPSGESVVRRIVLK